MALKPPHEHTLLISEAKLQYLQELVDLVELPDLDALIDEALANYMKDVEHISSGEQIQYVGENNLPYPKEYTIGFCTVRDKTLRPDTRVEQSRKLAEVIDLAAIRKDRVKD